MPRRSARKLVFVHFGKPKIVTDAESKAQIVERKDCERIPWSETGLFFYGRDRIQMSFGYFATMSPFGSTRTWEL